MRTFILYRSDLINLEYYHQYKQLEDFKKYCHDYYLLFPIWLLEKDYFDRVYIIRLTKNSKSDIVFNINGKLFIQKWVKKLDEVLDFPKPDVSFFRGGFRIYDEFTVNNPRFSNMSLYLGAGRRIFPQWQGKYDAYLIEDERDIVKNNKCIPFYKTASPHIFRPLDLEKKWDICWPCNFTQIKYKGQKLFIDMISKNPELQKLKIVHCGNKSEVGQAMCRKAGINNIEFLGHIERGKLNKILNQSRLGLNLSNLTDGCPRVSTEILMSGTPLILRDTVRLLDYFRSAGVVNTNRHKLVENILWALEHRAPLSFELADAIRGDLSFDFINQKNIDLWKKI